MRLTSVRRSAPARRLCARDAKAIAVAARNGSCAAAVYLQRQVIVADIARDALWENMREVALAAGLRSCWSTLIHASDGRILGTLALYFRAPRSPLRRDFELMARMTQLAGIAIERRMAEERLAASEARYRRLFDNVHGRRLQLDARRTLRVGQSGAGAHGRLVLAERVAVAADGNDLSQSRRNASRSSRRSSATARCATPSSSCDASTARR